MKQKLILISIVLLSKANCFAQNCDEVLKHGIYDYSSKISDEERANSFINWFKQSQFSSYESAKKSSADLGIVYGYFLLDLGYSDDEKGFQQFKNDMESYTVNQQYFKAKTSTFVQKINGSVISAWEKCINSDGMHFWLVQTENPRVFTIFARYIDDGANVSPSLTGFTFTPKNQLNIEEGAFFSDAGNMKDMSFNGATKHQSFYRTSDAAITININATVGKGLSVTLPEIKKPLPSITFSADKMQIQEGESIILQWHVDGAKTISIDNGIGIVDPIKTTTLSPNTTTTYTLKAQNESGIIEKAITINVNEVLLSSAKLTFLTPRCSNGNDCDNKNSETVINIKLLKNKTQSVANGQGGINDEWKDNDSYHHIDFNIKGRVTKKEILNGTFEVEIVPQQGHNDTWVFLPIIELYFSDGTKKESRNYNNTKISEKARVASFNF